MRTTTGLLLIAAGAILAFAVTTSTSFVNLHTVGYVLMIVGLAGMFIRGRRGSRLGRRLVRRTQWWPASERIEETNIPPYLARNPGDQAVRAGLPAAPSVLGSAENPGTYGGTNPSSAARGERDGA